MEGRSRWARPSPRFSRCHQGRSSSIGRLNPGPRSRPARSRFGSKVRPSALPQPPRFDQAIGVASVPMRYDLTTAGSFNFTGISDLGSGYERKVSITAKVDGVPPKKPARARILSIAPTFADPKIRPIKASQQDVKDLAPFFARHLVTEAGGPYSLVAPGEPGLVGKDATTERVLAALDRLAKESVEQGDLLVVMIETYVLAAPPSVKVDSRLVSSDSQTSAPLATTTIPVEVIGKALESLVRRGCRVVLVLDGTHNSPGWSSESNALEWARTLRNQSDVITILATTRRPIRDEHVERHRPLARALLESIRAANSRPSDPFMTLADLNTAHLRPGPGIDQAKRRARDLSPQRDRGKHDNPEPETLILPGSNGVAHFPPSWP